MSSTDQARLVEFYRSRLTPVAEALRERGVEFFALRPDDSGGDSWFEPGPAGEPELFEVEAIDAERALRARWEAEGLPELAGLAAELGRLADELRMDDEQAAELSPFLYVMY